MKNNIPYTLIAAVTLAITACTARAAFPVGADTFANAGIIPTANQNDYSADTNIAAFTSQAGEPANGAGRSAWWRWTAQTDGWCTIDTLRSNEASPGVEDSILAVYTGAAVNSLTLVAKNDDTFVPESYLSQVTFYATAGTTYSVVVDSSASTGAGGVVLRHRFFTPGKVRRLGAWYDFSGTGVGGIVDFSVTPAGLVTGKVGMGAKQYPFKSTVTPAGYFQVVIPRPQVKGQPPIAPLVLDGDVCEVGNRLAVCAITLGNDIYEFLSNPVLPFTPQTPHTYSPAFTASISTSTDVVGDGFFILKTTASGKAKFAGRMGDGTPFSAGSVFCGDQPATTVRLPVAFLGAGGRSSIFSTVRLDESASDSLDTYGGSAFHRDPAAGTFFPAGLNQFVNIRGRAYTKPAPGQRALGFLDTMGAGKFTIPNTMGETMGFQENLTLSPANKFTFTSLTRKPVLKLNPANGLVTGSVEEPAGTARKLMGILFVNGTPTIRGQMTGTTRTVRFDVKP